MNGRGAPTGVFDSGSDGLIVIRSLVDQLPNKDFVYLGNTARAPYSPRPVAQVQEFAIQGLGHLIGREVKALVIACSSASSAVLGDARERYGVPIFEVILPAARRILAAPDSGRVEVVCTGVTAVSRSYDGAFTAVGNMRLTTQARPRFVEFVGAGVTGGEELLEVVREYPAPLQVANIDTLILDCTHYPLLTDVISYMFDDDVTPVSSSDACAQDIYARLTRKGLLYDVPRRASRQLLTTGDADSFRGIGGKLLGCFVYDVEQVGLC